MRIVWAGFGETIKKQKTTILVATIFRVMQPFGHNHNLSSLHTNNVMFQIPWL